MEQQLSARRLTNRYDIPLSFLLTAAVSVLTGFMSGVAVKDFVAAEQISLSTGNLIAFVFTVAVGAASVVLAGVTITLSRSAEDALMRRSDEGIKLQNEVFIRTSEVLSSIKSSTGVTEKRIEDMKGPIAPAVQDALYRVGSAQGLLPGVDKKRLEQELTERLQTSLAPLSSEAAISAAEADARSRTAGRDAAQAKWLAFHEQVTSELSAREGLNIVSVAQGNLELQGPDFWDVIVEKNGRRAAVDIHTRSQLSYMGWFTGAVPSEQFLGSLITRAINDKLQVLFIVFDDAGWDQPELAHLRSTVDAAARVLSGLRIVALDGNARQVAEKLEEMLTGNGTQDR